MSQTILQSRALMNSTMGFPVISRDLHQVELILEERMETYRECFPQLIDHLSRYHGKRLRPMLLLLVASACGKITRYHHVLSAVVEMIHTATLVHDDVLDESELRRHSPTMNAKWGNKVSILLGDFLFTNAFHLSSSLGDAQICEWIGEATNRVCAGETLQLTQRGNTQLQEKTYFAIVEGKTASLTECATHLGAVFAGSDETTIQAMKEYGRALGIAFQIADDLMDFTGDANKIGKTLGTDLVQENLTLPMIYLLERLSTSERSLVESYLHEKTLERHLQIAEWMRKTGSLEDARSVALGFISQAQMALNVLPSSKAKEHLLQLTQWIIARDI